MKIFSVILFLLLGIYLLEREGRERKSQAAVYYEDHRIIRQFLIMMFVGILLRWFWGVLVISALISVLAMAFPVLNSDLGGAVCLSMVSALWMIRLIKDFQRKAPLFTVRDLLGLKKTKGSFWLNWIVPFLTGAAIATVASYALVYRHYQPVTPFSEMMDWENASGILGLFLFAAVVAAPFLEEVVFRGFFFLMITECKNARWAFWIVGASFGLLHMEQYWGDGIGIGAVCLLGFLLTGLRYFSGSAKPGIVLHYTFNTLMVVVPVAMFTTTHPMFTQYLLQQEKSSSLRKEDILKKSIIEDEQNAMAYNELAWIYLEDHNDAQQALVLADKALDIAPERTIFQHTRSEALYALGRTEEAMELLSSVHQKIPDNEEISGRFKEMQQGQ
jgi:membrane protease YdiL (CAAX protease family)